ncbi:hypothetical protein [Lutibacter citreus]|uniref:hypothetical protein n=1 Tax=Lutibacter citreus TaxID=2138210 RepID=UPI000DBE8402|nr:hypothetical protein [Lutibacter citreus]
MIIKLTKKTKSLLDVALISVGFEKLKELGINKTDFQLFVIENESNTFNQETIQYLLTELNLVT